MFKRILSLALALCALFCALPAPAALAAGAGDYYVEVDIANQITTVYRSADKAVVRQMICSTGKGGATPRGTFKLEKTRASTDRKEWYWISKYHCYVKYATRIKGPILFHSLPYSAKDMNAVDPAALAELGTKASHGCIRLRWEDAKWIAENCPDGTKVRIFTGAAKKNALRELLLAESYTSEGGMTYEQYTASTYVTDGADNLGRGATGDLVTALQQRLIGLGFFAGAPTGVYDNATIVAVIRFQAAASLPVTGILTPAQAQRILTEDAVVGDYSTLVPGSAGPVVVNVQRTLKALGFFDGPVSGVYGEDLEAAVRAFFRATRRQNTARVTPADRAAMWQIQCDLDARFGPGGYAMVLVDEGGVPTAHWGVPFIPGETELNDASVGQDIVLFQLRLHVLGFFNGDFQPICNAATSDAVAAWQASAGLEPTGVASPELQNAIYARDDVTGTRITLSEGMVGPALAAMQHALNALQYGSGLPFGFFDSATADAVRRFTRANGMAESAVATPQVQQAILNQYLDCEAAYGSGNYALTISRVETPVATTTKKTYLYDKQSASGKKMATLAKGAVCEVVSRGNNWHCVRHDGKTGYVQSKYVKLSTRVDEVAEFNAPDAPAAGTLIYGTDAEVSAAEAPQEETWAEAADGLVVEADEAPVEAVEIELEE